MKLLSQLSSCVRIPSRSAFQCYSRSLMSGETSLSSLELYSGNHFHSAAVLDTGVHGLNLELAMNAHDGIFKNPGRATLHKRSVHNAKFIDEVISSFAVIGEQKNNFRKWSHFVPCCVLYRRESHRSILSRTQLIFETCEITEL